MTFLKTSDAGYPTVVDFEGLGPCYYTLGPFAMPRRGEYYLAMKGGIAGDMAGAYVTKGKQAATDLEETYRVVRPTFHAVKTEVYVMGSPVIVEERDDDGCGAQWRACGYDRRDHSDRRQMKRRKE